MTGTTDQITITSLTSDLQRLMSLDPASLDARNAAIAWRRACDTRYDQQRQAASLLGNGWRPGCWSDAQETAAMDRLWQDYLGAWARICAAHE